MSKEKRNYLTISLVSLAVAALCGMMAIAEGTREQGAGGGEQGARSTMLQPAVWVTSATTETPQDRRWPIGYFGEEPIACETRVRFSPNGGAADLLINEIAGARERIRIAMYGLTNPDLVDALIAARNRGVDVALKLDRLQSGGEAQKAQIARLRRAHATVIVSGLSRSMHDKFAVIDGASVVTGSYNWTVNAERRNRENAVLLECPGGADLFEKEWLRIE